MCVLHLCVCAPSVCARLLTQSLSHSLTHSLTHSMGMCCAAGETSKKTYKLVASKTECAGTETSSSEVSVEACASKCTTEYFAFSRKSGRCTPAPTIVSPPKYSVTCRVFKYFNCRRNRVCKSKHQKSCISKMKCMVQKSAECVRVCRAKSNDKCDSRRCPADEGTCSKTCEMDGLPKDFWCRVQVAGL